MKRKSFSILALILACVCLLAACGKSAFDLSENAVSVSTDRVYTNTADPEDSGYIIITIGGRDYVPYGTQRGTIKQKMIADCPAYLDGDTNERVYTLIGTDDYIATFYHGGEMEQFVFWRALDTLGKDIETPEYITPLGYSLWE